MNGIDALSAINPRPTPVVIADQLREGIISGAFRPGDQLNEAQVARQLNVSRGPVREALHRLVQEGLLYARPNRGMFIEELDLRDVAEVYETREVIECAATEIITRSSAEDRSTIGDSLEAIVDRMHAALESHEWLTLGRIDLEFHTHLVASAGNSRLARAYSTLATEALISLSHFLPDAYPDRNRVVPDHLEIVAMIRDGDKDAIHSTLHRHLSLDSYQLHTHDQDGSIRHEEDGNSAAS